VGFLATKYDGTEFRVSVYTREGGNTLYVDQSGNLWDTSPGGGLRDTGRDAVGGSGDYDSEGDNPGGGASGPMPPTVGADLTELGDGDYDGQVGIIRVGTNPDDMEELFTWNADVERWIGAPHTVMTSDDTWAMDMSRQPIAAFDNAWARFNGGVGWYRNGIRGHVRHAVAGTAVSIAGATIPIGPYDGEVFPNGGQVLIRGQLITYTGYTSTGGSEALTGCSGGSGTVPGQYTPVIPYSGGAGGDLGGFGTSVVPLDHVSEMYDAGFTLEERCWGWLNGGQDSSVMDVAPWYLNRDLADDFSYPGTSDAPGAAGLSGPGILLTGPGDPLSAQRGLERAFEFFSTDWTAFAPAEPTKRVLIPLLFGKMASGAKDNGECYGYTLQLRWVA
jgi:hypothetical protein